MAQIVALDSRRPGSIEREGLGWTWGPASNPELQFSIEAVDYKGRDMSGEITVSLNGEFVHMAIYTLLQERSRQDLVKALMDRTRSGPEERMGSRWNWRALVEQFCVGVVNKEREGSPLEYTKKSAPRRKEYVVDHLSMKGKSNLLIAPGGHGKGIIAVAQTVSIVTRRGFGDLTVQPAVPIYLDWEDQYSDYDDRVNAYCRGLDIEVPSIAYQRMYGALPDKVALLTRKIREAEANYGVIDSMSAAMGTTGDRGSWDTIAQRFFDALDIIQAFDGSPMTWFIIGHVNAEGARKEISGKAFGSIQIMNRARNGWEMRSTQEPGSSTVHMRLFDAKWNHTGFRKPLGFRMEWGQDTVRLASEDPDEVTESGAAATAADRFENLLLRGALSAAMIALETGMSENSVRAILSKNKDRFEKDGKGFWSMTRPSLPVAVEGPLPWG